MTQNPYNIEPEKEPSSFRLISTLGIAGFLSGAYPGGGVPVHQTHYC